jgi:hypothetical protein
MDQASNSPGGARRNEDIALDLLKFVSMTAGIARTGTPSTGFVAGAATKPDDQITQLLALYSRCLGAVAGKLDSGKADAK